MARYYGPFTHLAFILTFAAWLTYLAALPLAKRLHHSFQRQSWMLRVGAPLFICLLVGGGLLCRSRWMKDFKLHGFDLREALRSRVQESYKAALPNRETYRAALATIPKGARVLAAIDAPFLLDFKEHEIFCIDDIGVVSPPPGLPIRGDAGALADYLAKLSITYLVYVKPDKSTTIYARARWQRPGLDAIWQLRAPYFLWFFDSAEKLSLSYPVTFESDPIVVLSLER